MIVLKLVNRILFIIVILLLSSGTHLTLAHDSQIPLITLRKLEFRRSAWNEYTSGDYVPGGSLLTGDWLFTNLIVYTRGETVNISDQFYQISIGKITDQFYPDSPFHAYTETSPTSPTLVMWWLYWLDTSNIEQYPSDTPSTLPLNSSTKPFLNTFGFLEGPLYNNRNLIIEPPLVMSVNWSSNGNWIIFSSDEYTTGNYYINRSLSLTYDPDGYLLIIEGDTVITINIHFHRYHFSWIRENRTLSSELPSTAGWTSLVVLTTIIAIITSRRIKKSLKK